MKTGGALLIIAAGLIALWIVITGLMAIAIADYLRYISLR